jgi:hypothetical protein
MSTTIRFPNLEQQEKIVFYRYGTPEPGPNTKARISMQAVVDMTLVKMYFVQKICREVEIEKSKGGTYNLIASRIAQRRI